MRLYGCLRRINALTEDVTGSDLLSHLKTGHKILTIRFYLKKRSYSRGNGRPVFLHNSIHKSLKLFFKPPIV